MKIRGQKFLFHSHVEWVALIRDQRGRCSSSFCPRPSEVKVTTELLSSLLSPSKVGGRLRVRVVSHEYAMLRLQEHNHAPLFELAPHQLRCFPSTGFADAFGPLEKACRPLTSRIDLPALFLPAVGQEVTDLHGQIPACDWLQS